MVGLFNNYGWALLKLRLLTIFIDRTYHCGAVYNYDDPYISDHLEEGAP